MFEFIISVTCEPNPCGEEHECVAVIDNVQGYTCKCVNGYFYDKMTCIGKGRFTDKCFLKKSYNWFILKI